MSRAPGGKKIRMVLITGNELRHRYAATRLAEGTRLAGIVSEPKSPAVEPSETLTPEDQLTIDKHFEERTEVERRLLGPIHDFPDTPNLEIRNGAVNDIDVLEWVEQRSPDLVVLYGSGIIKPPLLDRYENRMVNMHLGLSPYYRGAATNFWPLVHNEPECVGVTIHLAVAKVDAGAILAQVRPSATISDRAHELGTKAIMSGIDLMPKVLAWYMEGHVQPRPQVLAEGRVFRRKQFNADAVRTMWRNFDGGIMADYLSDLKGRRRRYPIVESPRTLAGVEPVRR